MLLNDEDLLRIERAYCAQSLAQFAERAWHVLEPATPLKWGWALDAICEHLEAVTSGEIKRLLINVPPGCLKSMLVGVLWPAWEWGPRNLQSMRYLGTAHKQDLAVRDSTKCRRLIQSEWFQKLWPIELTGDQNAKTKFENTKTGFRESMSFTSLTGSRADRVLCFPYDQCIMTEKGMLKIGDIVENKINVRILGANKDSLSWQKITRYDKNQKNQIVKIATKRGSIECTADHPIYVSGRGFVEARRLRKGDRIKSLISQDMRELREIISTSTKAVDWKGSGNMLCRLPVGAKSGTSINASEGFEKTRGIEDVVVESVGFLEKEEVTYNLCVEHDHVYFPGGFLAHNCDDPLSADDANSEAALRAAEITFTESLPTRVNNDESAIVVIMQRLHDKDTSGIILSRDLGYTHLCLPMRYEAERKCTTSIGFSDPRTKDGELLFPERFSEKQVKELETILGSYASAGQLQQRPAPREGGMFKRSWFNVVRAVPANTQFVRGWDLAATNGAGDWTVGVKLGRMPSGRFLIAGIERDQLSSAGVERLIVNTASQDGLECRISLPQDPGQAGKAQASYLVQKLAGYNVSTSTESGDKVTRAGPMAAQAEAGNIDILEGDWNDAFLNELSIFPAGAKDQTDAASRAFNELVMSNQFNLHSMV